LYRYRIDLLDLNTMRLRSLSLSLLVLTASASAPVLAQDPLDDVYGHAVHAFYRGDVNKAQQLLDQAISAGSVDPRAYYYRGLCLAALAGDTSAGTADFEKAAQLEIDGKKVVNVGKALERIQGAGRCEIERIRRDARLASRDKFLEMQRLRYEESRRLSPAIPARDADAPPSPIPAANDPFAPGADLSKGTPTPMPESKQPTPPATDDPFGDAPAAPAKDAPPAGDDPFGGPPPAGDDPFGG
jgi:hypothetical protein